MYVGTKSFDNTFSDTGSRSVSGQMVTLSGLAPRTDYSVVVTAINTAGFRRSSDPVVGTTLTGKLKTPHLSTHHSLHPSHHSTIPPSHFLCPRVVSTFFSASKHTHTALPPPPPPTHLIFSPPHFLTPHFTSLPKHPQLPWIL